MRAGTVSDACIETEGIVDINSEEVAESSECIFGAVLKFGVDGVATSEADVETVAGVVVLLLSRGGQGVEQDEGSG